MHHLRSSNCEICKATDQKIRKLQAELEGERNAVNVLRVAIRVSRLLAEDNLADMIEIARNPAREEKC